MLRDIIPGKFPRLGCSDFPRPKYGCCDSCHDDEGMGYGMLELYGSDGEYCGSICCAAWRDSLEPLSPNDQESLVDRMWREKAEREGEENGKAED